ncbi:MAG: hypothetical protein B0A82_26640 [Alkalinema sp. CACIAM 70d]|nr:MAG: hypothetical protein B0A82_26640 [Alkalinema sp. CACIAM 70d]
MNDTLRLSQTPPDRTSMNYAALRERGMELIRQLAKDSWTDHNVHDPGITLLEAFSYAMTELGFRLQLDMADLLRSGESHALPDGIPVHHVLSAAPVTLDDLRQILLDHPLVSEARITSNDDSEVPFYTKDFLTFWWKWYCKIQTDQPLKPEAFDLWFMSLVCYLAARSAYTNPNSKDDPLFASFTYARQAGLEQVHLRGLYEVILTLKDFEEQDLNSNIYQLQLPSVDVEVALPHWDEPEAAPFRAAVTPQKVELNPDGGGWQALPESQSYFGQLRVSYTDSQVHTDMGILLRITGEGELSDAIRVAIKSTSSGGLIDQFAHRVRAAYRGVLQIQRYVESWRNLCEAPVRLKVARVQEIALRARIEVTGSTDLEQLLAKIFFDIDLALTPPLQFYSLAEMRAQGKTAETLYDGPLLRHGFLSDDNPDSLAHTDQIHISDILRIIMRLRSGTGTDVVTQENPTGRDIVAVTDLALSNFVNNRPITTNAQDCLRLVEVDRYRPRLSLTKSRINFVRNDVDVSYDPARVEKLFTEMQRQQQRSTQPQAFSPVWPVQRGELLPVDDYYAFQNDLPRIYGVGEAGVPDSAGLEGQARALQTQGYLLLFEQFLADLTAQLGNINRFFSANSEEQATYFTRALFELPGMEKLLKRFPVGSDVNNPNNTYRLALQAAVESRDQFLDRRNRMLDHLLARQGEDMVSWAQELHRWAQKDMAEANPASDQLLAQMASRRQAVNARLIRDKAAFLADVPDLNVAKLQSFGNPLRQHLRQHPEYLQVKETSIFHWMLVFNDEPLLRSVDSFSTEAAAIISAKNAIVLAARVNSYQAVSAGAGRYRYQLKDETNRVVGESLSTWKTETAAQRSWEVAAAWFATWPREDSQGWQVKESSIFHWVLAFDEEHRLRSVDSFSTEAAAIISAEDAIVLAAQVNQLPDRVFYHRVSAEAGRYRYQLKDGADTGARVVGESLSTWAENAIQDAMQATAAFFRTLRIETSMTPMERRIAHLTGIDHRGRRRLSTPSAAFFKVYEESAEGFHTVEHILLRPQRGSDKPGEGSDPGDSFLKLSANDPYSQRLSLVFPSGYARDFSLDPAASQRSEAPPHRFRDSEFRRHVERMVEQACPAHLFPKIYWVDRHLPLIHSAPVPATAPPRGCFEHFETAYFNWLDTQLIPGMNSDDVNAAAREALILALNGVANAS